MSAPFADTWAPPMPGRPEDELTCPDCRHPITVHHSTRGCQAIDGESLCACPRRRSLSADGSRLVPRRCRCECHADAIDVPGCCACSSPGATR